MTRATRTKTYLVMAHLGGLATVSFFLSYGLGWPSFFKGLSVGLMLVPLFVMLLSQFRDEYVETLWHSGTSFAFSAIVLGFIALPFLEGVYAGIVDPEGESKIPAGIAVFVAIAAFYIGFHYRWLRGLK